jgi:hypothetical protein
MSAGITMRQKRTALNSPFTAASQPRPSAPPEKLPYNPADGAAVQATAPSLTPLAVRSRTMPDDVLPKVKYKHKGAANEMAAILWLLNQGYDVFRNVSQHGAIDLIAIRDNEALRLDVKSAMSAARQVSKEQRELGVKLLLPKADSFEITDPPDPIVERVCRCGKRFIPRRRNTQYCGRACCQRWLRLDRAAPDRPPLQKHDHRSAVDGRFSPKPF